jgi:hypothetical protein
MAASGSEYTVTPAVFIEAAVATDPRSPPAVLKGKPSSQGH